MVPVQYGGRSMKLDFISAGIAWGSCSPAEEDITNYFALIYEQYRILQFLYLPKLLCVIAIYLETYAHLHCC